MSPDPVLARLQERLGLAPDALGPTALRAAVRGRMDRLGVEAPEVYARRLDDDPEEFLALVEEVVVAESWFFRGAELFAFLTRHVLERRRGAGRPFRLLSAPCGAGQEPYSLAIALTEAGLPPAAWSVDAIDVSPRNLELARRAVYGQLAFREMSPALRDRYFGQGPDGAALCESIRNLPRFRQGNLLDPLLLHGEPPFDFILCRNLMIYLHAEARQRLLANLKRLLAPDGLIATGTAESLPSLDRCFIPTGSTAFVYRVAAEPPAAVALPRPSAPTPAAGSPVLSEPRTQRSGVSGSPPQIPLTPLRCVHGSDDTLPATTLARARQHADAGRLDAALADCTAHLEREGPSAEALSLLGILRQATGDEAEAVRCFQKALYCNPDHEEALVHLMLLCQSRGDSPQGARLRQRLDRLRREAES
jgi:chemotaxis protein methyltransferase WspC